jgi:hypothetical protein
MKQIRVLAATLLLLTGVALESKAQTPTIQREVRLVDPSSGSGYIGLKASTGTPTYTLTMPSVAPTANQVLTVSSISGGAVNLTWNSPDATGWSLTGNTGTTSANFLGTTDAQPLVFKTNNSTAMTLGSSGSVTVNALSSAAGTASTTANEGVVIADNSGLLTKASYASVVAVGMSAGPLLLNGVGGNAGEVLQSNGAGAPPTWSSAFVKGRGVVSVSTGESIAVAAATIDANDAINVTLEGTGADMPIPSYYVVRTASTGFTIYFSAPFTGSCNWSIINQ